MKNDSFKMNFVANIVFFEGLFGENCDFFEGLFVGSRDFFKGVGGEYVIVHTPYPVGSGAVGIIDTGVEASCPPRFLGL